MKPYNPDRYAHVIAGDLYGGMEPPDQWAQRISTALRAAYQAALDGKPITAKLPHRTINEPCPYCGAKPYDPCAYPKGYDSES